MDRAVFGRGRGLRGELTVPGDKSISHRAVMLGAIAEGETHAAGFLHGADCLSTIQCLRAMGAEIRLSPDETELWIRGRGLRGLRRPEVALDCGNSGTTMRLLSGILAAQDFSVRLTGDESIQRRPMRRITEPLSEMGAEIRSVRGNGCAPLLIEGRTLHGIRYRSPVASAQVKSALLFAGLYAGGATTIEEPFLSRDHSERMLQAMGASVDSRIFPDGRAVITVQPTEVLCAPEGILQIPGDISSAAYFLTAALLLPDSELLLRNVGVNPTRDGILRVYRSMGAEIRIENLQCSGGEEIADLCVRSSQLHGTEISGALIPALIDELPVIAAAAALSEGTTVIRDAAELKVKESNRIFAMCEGLRRLGIDAAETEDGMVIHGKGSRRGLHSAVVESFGDHRIAMSFAVLGLCMEAGGSVMIRNADCIWISFPGFFERLESFG